MQSVAFNVQGITYDTGGADVKYGGAMAGMHRDKCGAAFVAGFFQVSLMLFQSFFCCRRLCDTVCKAENVGILSVLSPLNLVYAFVCCIIAIIPLLQSCDQLCMQVAS